MSTPKLTRWFPGHIKPLRPGVYQQTGQCELGYQAWNGKFWGYWCTDADEAWRCRNGFSSWQSDPWRGLASDPKKGGAA